MATIFDELKWQHFQKKRKEMTLDGLKSGLIFPYSDKLIEKFRKIYYGGIPASIILLSDMMTNGYCYDRALLASSAFLDDDEYDVNLLYASIASLRQNPEHIHDKNYMTSDHCIVEITPNSSNSSMIIDTSSGFIYDKNLYWKIEKPKIRHINNKEKIKQFLAEDKKFHPENIKEAMPLAPLIIANIEKTYGTPTEMYSMLGIELLQKEIEHYKKIIAYNPVQPENGVCEDTFPYRVKDKSVDSVSDLIKPNININSNTSKDRE